MNHHSPAFTADHADVLMTADVAVAGWRSLTDPEQRWDWFQKLYDQAAHLDRRYRLGLRSGWWEDEIQIELLATLGAVPLKISAAPPASTTAASTQTDTTPIGADQNARLARPPPLIHTSAPTNVGAAPITAQPASDIHNAE